MHRKSWREKEVEFQDYYKTLGVERTATQEQIQRAYRKLARQYHPDINKSPDAEDKFKHINEAHEVLKDPETRKKYDELGAGWRAGEPSFGSRRPGGAERGTYQYYYSGGDEEQFSDFFRTFFGGGFGAAEEEPWRRRGRDQEADIEISIEDAFHGSTRTVHLDTAVVDAQGRLSPSRRTLEVKVPRGVTEGSTIRLAGQGGAGHGGENGDLYLRIRFAPHRTFQVEEYDLRVTLDLTPWEAALGTKVNAPTVDGAVKMTIPAGTQTGQVLRLKGKGLPKSSGGAGDELVTVRIVVPQTLTERERRLFEELARESTFSPRG